MPVLVILDRADNLEVLIKNTQFFDLPKPRLFGHRGDPARFVENTLPSFESALDCGVGYLEMDVWLTRDYVPVVHHDRYLSRIYGTDAQVGDLNLEEIKNLPPRDSLLPDEQGLSVFNLQDFGVPTFEEVLNKFPNAMFNLDFKLDSFDLVNKVLDIVFAYRLQDRVLFASEYDHLVDNSRVHESNIPVALGFKQTREFFAWLDSGREKSFETRGSALQIPEVYNGQKLLKSDNLNIAHDNGLEVHVWTVNDREKVREFIDMGVDGIMSDDAKMLVQEASNA